MKKSEDLSQLGQREETKRKGGGLWLTLLLLFALFLILFAGFQLFTIYHQYSIGRQEYTGLREETVVEVPDSPYLNIDFDALKAANPDFVAWIYIPGTDISYPIVHAADNNYYLRRSFEGQYFNGGCVFTDFRSPADFSGYNTVIYGHNLKDGTMFHQLERFLDQNFFSGYREIHIYRDGSLFIYRTYALDSTNIEGVGYTFDFDSSETYQSWMDDMRGKSIYAVPDPPEQRQPTITLSTCTNGNQDDRYLLLAYLDQEIILPD